MTVVIGGTFDPFTEAHLRVGLACRNQLHEDVIYVPAYLPWQKISQTLTPFAKRLEMARIACQDEPGLSVSAIEYELSANHPNRLSYTIKTLQALLPQLGLQPEEIKVYIGSDQLHNLASWKDAELLIQTYRFLTAKRADDLIPEQLIVNGINFPLCVQTIDLTHDTMPYDGDIPLDMLSSSIVRHRIVHGQTLKGLVPEAVQQFIDQNHLYRVELHR